MMKFCVLFLFLSVCALGFAAQPGEEGYCTPGTNFKQDCNTCHCTDDGRNAVCTLKACLSKREVPQNQNQPCTPGESVRRGCETCTCDANGQPAQCFSTGCFPGRKRRGTNDPNAPGFSCEPGTTFKHDCNTCKCNSDGKSAGCTYMLCPKQKRQAEQCSPGETKMQDCNSCRCVDGGWACTRKACPHTLQKREAGSKCEEEGLTLQLDCNKCRCVHGEWACEKKTCPNPKSNLQKRSTVTRDTSSDKNCKDGEVIQRDCNTCRCIPGAGFACTRRACLTKREEPVDMEFNGTACSPNDKFQFDCNTCYCNHDGSGYSCTEKFCGTNL